MKRKKLILFCGMALLVAFICFALVNFKFSENTHENLKLSIKEGTTFDSSPEYLTLLLTNNFEYDCFLGIYYIEEKVGHRWQNIRVNDVYNLDLPILQGNSSLDETYRLPHKLDPGQYRVVYVVSDGTKKTASGHHYLMICEFTIL